MKFLTPTLHGLGDYVAAVVLIVAPFILDIKDQSVIGHWLSIVSGISLIIYSLFTNYTFSIAKVIPFKVHLVFDSLAGLAMIAMAFVLELDMTGQVYFIAMGAGVLVVVTVTQIDA